MAIGPIGGTGTYVVSRVLVEPRVDPELVPIPRQRMVEHSVLGIIAKVTTATDKLAQVKHTLYKIHLYNE